METFADREKRVINFMDEVKATKDQEAQDEAFKKTDDYKLKCLNRNQDDAKGVCLDMVFSKIYKDALPLNNDYKVAHGEDLDAEMKDFIQDRCPKGMAYYVREGIKKGSKPAKKIMDETNKIVEDDYNQKAMNLEDYNADDMVFRMTGDNQKKIDVMNSNLNLDGISDVIRDNVKSSAISEIKRAKEEKDSIKQFESELANDMNVTDESAIDNALELYGFTEKRDFQPTLFQGIMIGKMNQLQKMQESGNLEPEYIYDTLAEYGLPEPTTEGTHYATIGELAFVESVKEYTKLNILKALKLEKFDINSVNELANNYASK